MYQGGDISLWRLRLIIADDRWLVLVSTGNRWPLIKRPYQSSFAHAVPNERFASQRYVLRRLCITNETIAPIRKTTNRTLAIPAAPTAIPTASQPASSATPAATASSSSRETRTARPPARLSADSSESSRKREHARSKASTVTPTASRASRARQERSPTRPRSTGTSPW